MARSKEEIEAYQKKFSEEETAFYALVGRTIDQWVWVEDSLHRIFQNILASPHSDRVSAVFYSQINFRAKLDMTDAAIQTFVKEPLLGEWVRLFKRLKKKAQKRAQIAHNHITLEAQAAGPGTLTPLRHVIKPESNKPANRLAYVSGTDDINYQKLKAILLEFLQVRSDLDAFLVKLGLPPQASPEPNLDQNPSNNPNNQSGAERP